MRTAMQRLKRVSSTAAARRIASQARSEDGADGHSEAPASRVSVKSPLKRPKDDASDYEKSPEATLDDEEPTKKRRKPTTNRKKDNLELHERLFGTTGQTLATTAEPPARRHQLSYHRPLLLDGPLATKGREALLSWFDTVSATRKMPWRKPWIDPREHQQAASGDGGDNNNSGAALRSLLERRAYEVWISEIMLQQTRVAVVIDYWNRWMAKWPTIQDLAAAAPEDVVAAWRGLGYYSRATRIHEAAKLVVGDGAMRGLLPRAAAELEEKVPGVGRYTAGAISAIVFGHAAPMVDGNVLRVLSRQLGILGNVKTDKRVVDALWAAADALVGAVARDVPEGERDAFWRENRTSDRPGRWGQALMELGSTVCTPKPNCALCPISSTCRAYAEGTLLAKKGKSGANGIKHRHDTAADIEDMCTLCEPYEDSAKPEEEADGDTAEPLVDVKVKTQAKKQATLASFFSAKNTSQKKAEVTKPAAETIDAKSMEIIANHARRFPIKVVKKPVREEETLVCAIRRRDGQYLIEQRPEKGLLAGLWEFISLTLPDSNDSSEKSRKTKAQTFIAGFAAAGAKSPKLKHHGELGSVPWLFSHLKLTMHVHLFTLEDADERARKGMIDADGPLRKWATSEAVDDESMGTGMRKCWALVKEAE